MLKSNGFSEENFIHIRGDDQLLAAYYAGAAVFIYPSLYEGFGFPPLEAMAMDCPVICANAGSLPEIVGDAAELVDPIEPEDIAHAMKKVLLDSEYADLLKARGRQNLDRFSWQQCAEQTGKVYSSLA